LIYRKAVERRSAHSAEMNKPARLSLEIEGLEKLAAWYRQWSELAGNDEERRGRILLAEHIEDKARRLRAAND
jgi:hypothetical protein